MRGWDSRNVWARASQARPLVRDQRRFGLRGLGRRRRQQREEEGPQLRQRLQQELGQQRPGDGPEEGQSVGMYLILNRSPFSDNVLIVHISEWHIFRTGREGVLSQGGGRGKQQQQPEQQQQVSCELQMDAMMCYYFKTLTFVLTY